MGDFIEVLTSNPFIIIILIGFISSLFKRFKATPEPPAKKSRPAKIPDITIEDYFPVQPKKVEQKKEISTYHQEVLKKLKEKTNSEAEEEEKISSGMVPSFIKVEPKPIQVPVPTRLDHLPSKPQFSRNKLVEGIILSEVLGPPRSKKPYFRTR
ncbi:hypothetical protein [Peribacillus alkalitolerans]|uniref:hypothetical protein n=1 Tax=Peribacillus alkalitolerans TaxID=1550385 RepID=UPI0013D01CA1|nr:hypothetical protein [Peribacillus alkalitolerans]